MASGQRWRERRSSEEVRTALVGSATHLFARHGFSRTTTAEIARRAGVAETALFRHFGSKSGLFAEAVVSPFIAFVESYAQRWWAVVEEPVDNEVLLRSFMNDLYDEMRRRRDAMVALVTADPDAVEAVTEARRRLNHFFAELRRLAERRASAAGGFAPVFSEELTTRFVVGLLVLVTAFDPWFLPEGWEEPSKEAVLDAMARLILHGVMSGAPPPVAGEC